MFRQRFLARFRKVGDLRFVGHADLMRTFERALRRTGLPLRMTEGFNPHPKISFPAPLAVGWEGEQEVMEFELAEWVPLEEVVARLAAQLPQIAGGRGALELVSVKLAPPVGKAQPVEAEYVIEPDEDSPVISEESVRQFMAQTEVWAVRQRKGGPKRDNIRSFVREVMLESEGRIRMRMALSPSGTARPDEVLVALGVKPEDAREKYWIRRTAVRLQATG